MMFILDVYLTCLLSEVIYLNFFLVTATNWE